MLSTSLVPLAVAIVLTSDVLAAPHPQSSSASPSSMNLHRRAPTAKTADEWAAWAQSNRDFVQGKYGGAGSAQKRSSGQNLIVNQNGDSSFFGSLAIGTPPVSYDVILDTGSADLWVAGSDCITGCDGIITFDTSDSSTFHNQSTSFRITYGSGAAAGSLATDVVQMAGFSVSDQVFAVCDQVSSGLLTNPVSGLLGLGFQSIASSGATPLWETLVQSGAWDSPLMAFQLTRYINDSNANQLQAGGTFTMGAVNSSLFTGDIEYNDIPSGQETYWIQTLSSLTSQGNSISLPSGSSSYAAIDTGTTLVGGPSTYISQIYAQIEGSAPGTGQYEGYYTYPCSSTVNVTMAFGGRNWAISNADFQVTQLSRTTCLGAFFELSTGGNAPAWIVGDTFLKNVYSVFRFNPASVGFAQLSDTALAMNGADTTVPSPTIGSVAAAVSATGSSTRSRNSGISSRYTAFSIPLSIAMAIFVTLLKQV